MRLEEGESVQEGDDESSPLGKSRREGMMDRHLLGVEEKVLGGHQHPMLIQRRIRGHKGDVGLLPYYPTTQVTVTTPSITHQLTRKENPNR